MKIKKLTLNNFMAWCEKWKAIDEDGTITIKNVLERWRR